MQQCPQATVVAALDSHIESVERIEMKTSPQEDVKKNSLLGRQEVEAPCMHLNPRCELHACPAPDDITA
jgi:hypothetical protein